MARVPVLPPRQENGFFDSSSFAQYRQRQNNAIVAQLTVVLISTYRAVCGPTKMPVGRGRIPAGRSLCAPRKRFRREPLRSSWHAPQEDAVLDEILDLPTGRATLSFERFARVERIMRCHDNVRPGGEFPGGAKLIRVKSSSAAQGVREFVFMIEYVQADAPYRTLHITVTVTWAACATAGLVPPRALRTPPQRTESSVLRFDARGRHGRTRPAVAHARLWRHRLCHCNMQGSVGGPHPQAEADRRRAPVRRGQYSQRLRLACSS